jgi:hypothetical protein
MTEKEKNDWHMLCDYAKYELLGYSSDMKFPKFLALRFKGLAEGNFISNKRQNPNASYTYEQILIASKLCSPKIKNYFYNNSAKITDERHKINLIMMFIEQEINNVVIKMKEREKATQEINKLSFESHTNDKAEYKSETTEAKDKFNELW